MQKPEQPQATKLQDYSPPAFLIDKIELEFDLDPEQTRVQSRLLIRRNPAADTAATALEMDGEQLQLLSIQLDGKAMQSDRYAVCEHKLSVFDVPDTFVLELITQIQPDKNTALEGLYLSSGNFCTQCEAEGFRRITYYLDRPDVLARFDVTIRADIEQYPVLLSNGNKIAEGRLDDSRHWVRWQDPFPKPCYLFALVGGDLVAINDRYKTASGREVELAIYVQTHNRDKCGHAMQSLKNAMQWDERVFGLEYDLDNYMIVAVDDFNMGAMENKGLNIFNSKFVLASRETATDVDYQRIEGVIAHEYFHNWTGNRVTCRDWFQLSLKEGLTVFRDQEFSSDMSARAVKRIQDVQLLRTMQFAEDAGPMAHPVRPESYIEINNFYTVTVYEKGAELIRMQRCLLGADGFRRGMDLYFQRHDGHAVTIEDFIAAMEDANHFDLAQFRRWYSQAGTPELEVEGEYNAEAKTYRMIFRQSCPAGPDQIEKLPVVIPVSMGLLDKKGQSLALHTDIGLEAAESLVLTIGDTKQQFIFYDVPEQPVPSLLRDFSAPVKLEFEYADSDLHLLMTRDSDSFNRWEACQRYAERLIRQRVVSDNQQPAVGENGFIAAVIELLEDDSQDAGLLAEALALPNEKYLGEQFNPTDPQAIFRAREDLRRTIANNGYGVMRQRYLQLHSEDHGLDAIAIARRALKNLCLSYVMCTGKTDAIELCVAQYRQANNMTDRLAALGPLVDRGGALADDVLRDFRQRYSHDPLVLDKWFAVQASSRREDALQKVLALTGDPAFSLTNPNRLRSLLGVFSQSNPVRFHCPSGGGYQLLADYVLKLNELNPQVAARLLAALNPWRRLMQPQSELMHQQLQRILEHAGLSRDVYEIANKALAGC
ncbi:MAG: aminopeptidase N [Gammaproteobacteria bacterium]|nr:aminopeptidase N [Gammaproteobacteria bacterium]